MSPNVLKLLKRSVLIFIFIISAFLSGFSQNKTQDGSAKVDRKLNLNDRKLNLNVGAAIGMTRFFGDIEDGRETNVHVLGNRKAYELSLRGNLSNSFSLGLNAIYGEISGNENTSAYHRNFEADLLNIGLNIEYNFNGFYKKRIPVLTPFIGSGISLASISKIRTDQLDANGNEYHYWSDGKIRDLPELPENRYLAEKISRDYDYETVLNSGSVNSLAVPVYGGVDLHISKLLTFRLSSKYYFALSDDLDNFNKKGPSRDNDGYFFNSISMHVSLTSRRDDEVEYGVPEMYLISFKGIEKADEDGDGVRDMKDKCAGTPAGIDVNKYGCPIDKDEDGVPNYADTEPETPEGLVTDLKGAQFDYNVVEKEAADSTLSISHHLVKDNIYLHTPDTVNKFTVHVSSVSSTVPDSIRMKLDEMPGLNKYVISDSLTVYTLGNYNGFANAELKKNELLKQGMDDAFEVKENHAKRVASDLEGVALRQRKKKEEEEQAYQLTDFANGDKVGTAKAKAENPDVVKFKVEVMSFESWASKDQITYVMAREGVEIRSAYTVKAKIYTIGSYDTEYEAELLVKELKQLGVKDAHIFGALNTRRVSLERARELVEKKK